MSDIIKYLKNLKPKTEDEIVEEIKDFVENNDFTLKELNKMIKQFSVPYDYKEICDDILKQFGVIYKVADVKKLLVASELIPDENA